MWNYPAVAAGGMMDCCARHGLTQLVQPFCGRNFPYALNQVQGTAVRRKSCAGCRFGTGSAA